MVNKQRTHLLEGHFGRSGLAMKHLNRQEFGRRLYNLMLSKNWTQSELARRANVLRDSVSNYINGNHMPTAQNLNKLAKTLGVKPEELLPNLAEQAIEAEDRPSLEIVASGADPSKSWLRVNRLVRTATAAKVINMLEEDNASD